MWTDLCLQSIYTLSIEHVVSSGGLWRVIEGYGGFWRVMEGYLDFWPICFKEYYGGSNSSSLISMLSF